MSEAPLSALVIGGSAGSIEPLKNLLSKLPPPSSQFAVICVLHVLGRQKSLLPEVFRHTCPWIVKEAESTEPVANGTVYFAPPDYHLSVEKNRTFALSNEEPILFSRPSIDLFFHSVAPVYKTSATCLVLSGANHDGTSGMLRILKYGGRAFAQALDAAEFPEMPKSALAASSEVQSATISQVVEFLHGRP